MRPGPGLVVMALAFISGARRGSTSSISSKTTITTSSPPPIPPPTTTNTTKTTAQFLTITKATQPPSIFYPTTVNIPSTSSSSSSSTSSSYALISSTSSNNTILSTSSPPSQQISEDFTLYASSSLKEPDIGDNDDKNNQNRNINDHETLQINKQSKEPVPFNFLNQFFIQSFPTSTYPLPSHLAKLYDDPRSRTEAYSVVQTGKHTGRANRKFRKRRKRRTRSVNINYRGSGSETADGDINENLNQSDDSINVLTTAVDSSSSSSDSALSEQTPTLARGLPVQFPSLTAADTISSIDEDDIFALVAEDDLLSEESFDHLIQLTNDKIGDTNEEDYSSGTESIIRSSSSSGSSSGSGDLSNVHDLLPVEGEHRNAFENFVHQQPHYQHEQQPQLEQQQHGNNKNSQSNYNTMDEKNDVKTISYRITTIGKNDDNIYDNNKNNGEANGHESESETKSESKNNIKPVAYNAHLVGNSNERLVSIIEKDSQGTLEKRIERKTETATTIHPKADQSAPDNNANRYSSILQSSFAITRLNPWISACDLAQRGSLSAPDLQGECSAGTLPVARVEEGPGPPMCLESCKKETPFTNKLNKDNMINNNLNKNMINNNNNNSKQTINIEKDNKLIHNKFTTTNNFNIKLRNSQPTASHSSSMSVNNYNYYNNNNRNSNNNNNNKQKNTDDDDNNNLKQKLLKLFNYYQNNNNNSNSKKMDKIHRNLNEKQLAFKTSIGTTTKTTATRETSTEAIRTSVNATNLLLTPNGSHLLASVNSHSSGDYELLHEFLMQNDEEDATNDYDFLRNDHQFTNDAAIATAANTNNNNYNTNNNYNIVKKAVTIVAAATSALDDNNNNNNNNHNQYEFKYNPMNRDYNNNNNNNNNNNKRYLQRFSNNSDSLVSSSSTSPSSLSLSSLSASTLASTSNAVNNKNSDQYLHMPSSSSSSSSSSTDRQQQQCLDYLGDSNKSQPMHLCNFLTPSERLVQLRHLRLRNCCERNVYSALHTLALNVTLSGGTGCLRVLEDLMDLDALASRITCGLTEILFRFDCRQVYSIIHQCDDCKEAYRRWVCSTLVPYFAETSDVIKPPEIFNNTIEILTSEFTNGWNEDDGVGHFNLTSQPYKSANVSDSNNSNNNTTMASNMTTSHNAKTSHDINNKNTNKLKTPIIQQQEQQGTSKTDNNNDVQQYRIQQLQQQQEIKEQKHHHVNRRNIQNQQHFHRVTQKSINIVNNNNSNSKSNNNNKNNNNKINYNKYIKNNDIHYQTTVNHNKKQPIPPPPQQQWSSTTTLATKALTFNDIVITIAHHNSHHATTLRNPVKFPSLNSALKMNSLNDTMAFNHNVHHKSTNIRRNRSENSKIYAAANVDENSDDNDKDTSTSILHKMQQQQQQYQEQKSLNFISTANTEDSSYTRNPVITRVFKRTKRKEFEFRKRRRIRPCLSVCQTVEQKCPYLLPADRAPSLPTQYAGEPTFLCLDYNIAETEEQLRKASHGPNDCCYTYCSGTANGICTYCDDMWDKTEIEREAETLSEERATKIHNVPMKIKSRQEGRPSIRVETKIQQKLGEEKNDLKMSTVAIAVLNNTAFEKATRLAERLQYYAFCEGVFYYDDQPEDMPEFPTSENCPVLPSVQSRCTIPYFATNYISSADTLGSYRKNNEAQQLLIWLSTLLCLWSCYSARSLRLRRYTEVKKDPHRLQLLKKSTILNATASKSNFKCQSCKTREIMQIETKREKIFKVWYDQQEKRTIIILYSVAMASTCKIPLKSVARYLRLHLGYSSKTIKLNLNKFNRISAVSFSCNCREKESLCFLSFRKREYKTQLNLMFVHRKCLAKCRPESIRDSRVFMRRHRKSIIDFRFSFKKEIIKKHFYYHNYYSNNYYYRSCRQVFSGSCNNKKYNKNNIYYNNLIIVLTMMRMMMMMSMMMMMMSMMMIYINIFKYNFNNCNFNMSNKIIIINIMKINCKKISIPNFNTIKAKTTTTTTTRRRRRTATHIVYYNESYNSNKKNKYIIIIIIRRIKINPIIILIMMIIMVMMVGRMLMITMDRIKSKLLRDQNQIFITFRYLIPTLSPTNTNSYKNYYNENNIYYLDNNTYLYNKLQQQQQQTQQIINNNTLYVLNKFIKIFTSSSIMFTEMLKYNLKKPFHHSHHSLSSHNNYNNNKYDYHRLYNNYYNSKDNNNNKFNPSLSPYNTSCYSKKLNYRYFYYHNFNINDWWQRRWWWLYSLLLLGIMPLMPILPPLTLSRIEYCGEYHSKHYFQLCHLIMLVSILENLKRNFHPDYFL